MLMDNLAEHMESFFEAELDERDMLTASGNRERIPGPRPAGKDPLQANAARRRERAPAGNGAGRGRQRGSVLPFAPGQKVSTPASIPGFDVRIASRRCKSPWEEMPAALRAYDRIIEYMHRTVSFTHLGALNFSAIEDVLVELVGSLRNNMDVLISIPRIVQRDNYLYTHSANVSILLAAFALCCGKGEQEALLAAQAGLLFDLGKTLLPKSLLHSNRKLTETEQSLVRRHPLLGHNLLVEKIAKAPPWVLSAALEHHERFDGSGYPRGIAGSAISDIGHLAAIADTYDALVSRRLYREALSPSQALGLMYRRRESDYHADFLSLFIRMVGIYPVGSIVQLRDGYRGVVTGSNISNPLKPRVMLVMDANGLAMPHIECDLARDDVADIVRCLKPEETGIHPHQILGFFTSAYPGAG
ncbi:HD domain-containing protein [Desulfovibrio sp. OttesenSCG-928-A18]|nr:HD domain-containing protein [Desulfovibrio sp. OttesenSCG-928-A18]